MGTNYYLHVDVPEVGIPHEIHIGKASVGWPFSFRPHKELGLNTPEDVKSFVDSNCDVKVVSEYWVELSPDEFVDMAHNWGCDHPVARIAQADNKRTSGVRYNVCDYDFF